MELFAGLSDDQKAMAGCAIAVAVCGGLLALSNLFGQKSAESDEQAALKFPSTADRQAAESNEAAEERPMRRAA